METVSFKAVIETLYSRSYAFNDFGDFEDVKSDIEALPRSESAGQAHWIGIEHDGYTNGQPVWSVLECSGCGYETRDETDYCGHCGAKMAKEVVPNESKVD